MKAIILSFVLGVISIMPSNTFGQLSSIGNFTSGSSEVQVLYADSITHKLYISAIGGSSFNNKPTSRLAYYDFNSNSSDTMPTSAFLTPNWDLVYSIIRINNLLYFAGNFKYKDSAGITRKKSYVKFDGQNWLLNDTNCCNYLGQQEVKSIFFSNDTIYAGSFDDDFDNIVPKNNVIGFNSLNDNLINLPILDTMSNSYKIVNAICKYQNDIYACGNMSIDTNNNNYGIAKLVNNTWQKLGNGFSTGVFISDMIEYNGMLVCAGSFQGWNLIKVWDGTNWLNTMPLIDITTPAVRRVYDLELYNGILFAAGKFTLPDGSKNIAKWDGTNWVGVGITSFTFNGASLPSVNSIQIYNNSLYIAGLFNSINGQTLNCLAKFDNIVDVNELSNSNISKLNAFPNPSRDYVDISCPISWEDNKIKVELYNITGQIIKSVNTIINNKKCNVSTSDIPPGIYSLSLKNEKLFGKARIIKL